MNAPYFNVSLGHTRRYIVSRAKYMWRCEEVELNRLTLKGSNKQTKKCYCSLNCKPFSLPLPHYPFWIPWTSVSCLKWQDSDVQIIISLNLNCSGEKLRICNKFKKMSSRESYAWIYKVLKIAPLSHWKIRPSYQHQNKVWNFLPVWALLCVALKCTTINYS